MKGRVLWEFGKRERRVPLWDFITLNICTMILEKVADLGYVCGLPRSGYALLAVEGMGI